MQETAPDLEFLLRAANYGSSDFSEPARKAVDAVAERIRTVAQLQLQVVQERAKLKNPAELAAAAESQDEDLS